MALTDIRFDTEYRSAQADLGRTFYSWCLDNSSKYDRAVGYFRSTVLIIIGSPVVHFAMRGGRIRLVCSPDLTSDDIHALERGHAQLASIAASRLSTELEKLLEEDALRDHVRVLATLVALGVLEVKIALRRRGGGIFHEKIGVFEDEVGNAVTFLGSANETWQAWDKNGNYEAIEVFCSWTSDAARVKKHRTHFERVWADQDEALTVLPFPEAVRQRLCSVAAHSLDELIPKKEVREPQRPNLRDHQKTALENWERQGFRGVLKHATGSGKTITALFAIKNHLSTGGVALVLVPAQMLLEQWKDEIDDFFGDANLLLAGAGNDSWRDPGVLRSFTTEDPLVGGRIVLATMQTARSPQFTGRIRGGAHLLLVADEVHQIGSQENSKVLEINAGKRLGLSATPERYRDSAGTQRIFDYFGALVDPEYTLADAIRDKHLVNYEYHPHVVQLTETEGEEWRTTTEEISKLFARLKAGSQSDEHLKDRLDRLLIKRSRIAKNAENKIAECQNILRSEYQRGQRWLVYCDNQEQLQAVLTLTRVWCADVLEYHTAMRGDRAATLSWFQEHGGVLVAIACLDEGVNIPSISHAAILASSQNPRQFIQRRGRILRRHQGKRLAYIYDVLVSPERVDAEPTQESLLKSELRRALEFAQSASNPSAVSALRVIAVKAGVDPSDLADMSNESDDNDSAQKEA